MQVFNGLLDANNHNLSAYRMVATAIRDLGRPDEAVVLLEQGRARAKASDPKGRNVGAFTIEIAGYYKQMGDSRRALDEYLDYAAVEPRNFRFIRDRMIGVLADDETESRRAGGLHEITRRAGRRRIVCRGGCAGRVLPAAGSAGELARDGAARGRRQDVRRRLAALHRGRCHQPRGDTAARGTRTLLRPRASRAGRHTRSGIRSRPRWTGRISSSRACTPRTAPASTAAVPAAERPVVSRTLGDGVRHGVEAVRGQRLRRRCVHRRGDVLLRKLKRPKDAMEVVPRGLDQRAQERHHYAGRIAQVYIATARARGDRALPASRSLARTSPPLAQAAQYYTGALSRRRCTSTTPRATR